LSPVLPEQRWLSWPGAWSAPVRCWWSVPHWETELATVSQLTTLHDFGGFDPALYALQYAARGSAQGAQEVVAALSAAGLPATTDAERGLDHGAWMPLRVLFPAADVTVVPLSIQHHGGPEHAYSVG
jgi:4,5-DOPA dioxygenase extradiol